MLLDRQSKITGNQTRPLLVAIHLSAGAISIYLSASIIVGIAGIYSAHRILARPYHLIRKLNFTLMATSLGHVRPAINNIQGGTQLEA